MTSGNHIRERRLSAAQAALSDPTDARPIRQIAESVGFFDHSQVARAFGRVYGCTPGDVRRAALSGHVPLPAPRPGKGGAPANIRDLLLGLSCAAEGAAVAVPRGAPPLSDSPRQRPKGLWKPILQVIAGPGDRVPWWGSLRGQSPLNPRASSAARRNRFHPCGPAASASAPPDQRCTSVGAKNPSAAKPTPITPSSPPAKASSATPVITLAEASTIPTWKAAEPISYWW
ncbi:AraC family transcriptional regulator [Roseomonas eburnea]|uniref:AraC family transcriptional regulator n=1 Tax=Neoroseomonas eburnea TaxID=1346889 RepID=A0A9X9XJ79_9PROT|nr:AraC family transcriptional regulator [Neoroseomonas eburnea]